MIGFMLIFVSISNMSTAEGFNKECYVILRLQHNFLSNIIFEDIDFRVSVYIEQVEPAMGILFFFMLTWQQVVCGPVYVLVENQTFFSLLFLSLCIIGLFYVLTGILDNL